MNQIAILNFIDAPYGDSQLGLVECVVNNKIKLTCKLCKSKAGHKFIGWSSLKVDGQWKSAFSLSDSDSDRKLRDDVLAALNTFLEQNQAKAPPQPQNAYQEPANRQNYDSNDELPF